MTQITDDEINKILTGDWTAGQVATFEALHFTGEEILIAGLEAELEKRDRVINALDQQLCEARVEIERLQTKLSAAKTALGNEQGLRRQIGRLINRLRQDTQSHYYIHYNPQKGIGIRTATLELEGLLVEWKTEATND